MSFKPIGSYQVRRAHLLQETEILITLKSFMASIWMASEDSVVSGDAMLSLL
jgi:hypothetical protein